MESSCAPLLEPPCFVCCKKYLASNSNKNCQLLFTHICRYIKISLESCTEEPPNICQECYPILETFSEIYKEWTSLQKKLNEKISQIVKFMKPENQRGNNEAFDGVELQPTRSRKSSEFRNKFIACANNVVPPKVTSPDANNSPTTTTYSFNHGNGGHEEFDGVEIQQIQTTQNSEFRNKIVCANAVPPKVTPGYRNCTSTTNYRTNHNHDEPRFSPEPPPRTVNKTTRQNPIPDKSVECRFCGKRLANLSSRWHHENIHRGVKLHQCRVCNRQFSQKTSLLSHQLVHTGDKPFKCEICGTGFSSARNCRLHQERSHSEGERLKLESTRMSPQIKTYGKSRKTPQYKMTYGLPPSEEVLVTTKSEAVEDFLDESVHANAYESDVAMSNRGWNLQQQQQTSGDIAGDEIKFEVEVDPLALRFH